MRSLVIAITLLVAACIGSPTVVRAEYPTDDAPSRTHPILHFTDPQETVAQTYDAATFKKMNRLWLDPERHKYGRPEIRVGEYLACGDLHRLLLSKSPAAVRKLIGKPTYVTGSLPQLQHQALTQLQHQAQSQLQLQSQPESQLQIASEPAADQNWLYYMGYDALPVRIGFAKGKCVRACACDSKLADTMEKQIFAEIRGASLGKTVSAISKALSYPLTKPEVRVSRTSLSFAMAPDKSPGLIDADETASKNDFAESAVKKKSNETVLNFVATPVRQIGFHFTNDRCDDVFEYAAFGW